MWLAGIATIDGQQWSYMHAGEAQFFRCARIEDALDAVSTVEFDSLGDMMRDMRQHGIQHPWDTGVSSLDTEETEACSPVRCVDCGIPYQELGVDLVLPDQQWRLIFPEEYGILCANCICQRVAKMGGTAIQAWVACMDMQTKYREGQT